MRTGLAALFTSLGILIGFFMGGCALLMIGLGVYKFAGDGFAAGWELVYHSWPFVFGGIAFLAAVWFGIGREAIIGSLTTLRIRRLRA